MPVADRDDPRAETGAQRPPSLVLPGRFRAAIFDMDGLLLDSESGWERAEFDLFRSRGVTMTAEDRLATVGHSMEDAVAIYIDRLGLADDPVDLAAEIERLVAEEYRRTRPQPGATELVTALRGRLPLGLASNTHRWLVDIGLAATGFAAVDGGGDGAFDVIVTSDDVPRPKPEPDVYLLACGRLGVRPSDAIALEDSTSGVASATTAGLFTVAVPISPRIDVSRADLVLPSLAAIEVEPKVG